MSRRISKEEIEKYWTIFATLSNNGSHLTGAQAAGVLKNSGLDDDKLAQVWDLADVDNDGNLDFEEFCVAMRLIFDLVNGEISSVPKRLPDFLVPESKAHLITATAALGGQDTYERAEDIEEDLGLKDGFDWYMSPSDKGRYEAIYDANADRHGSVTFDALQELYNSLDVPDSEVKRAWNLVNPQQHRDVNKDACLVFLHILNNRNNGYRIPRTVPASLRASFERKQIDYNVNRARTPTRSLYEEDDRTQTYTSKKAAFGDGYLSRLGVGGQRVYQPKGTDFTETQDEDWEEVRLRKQLAELEKKLEDAEMVARRNESKSKSSPAVVRRQLEQLLDFKRRELRELDDAGANAKNQDLASVREDLEMMKQQIEGLESHLKNREQVLSDLQAEVENEKLAAR